MTDRKRSQERLEGAELGFDDQNTIACTVASTPVISAGIPQSGGSQIDPTLSHLSHGMGRWMKKRIVSITESFISWSNHILGTNKNRCEIPFFMDLCRAREINGWLVFVHDLSPMIPGRLFIRDCYKFLGVEILKIKGNVIVSGTPGVGKTVFLYYLLWLLIVWEQRRVLFVHHPFMIFFDRDGKIFDLMPQDLSRSSDAGFWNKDLFVLFDSFSKTEVHLELFPYEFCTFILSTSPRRDLVNDFKKLETTKFYVPPWSADEMLELSFRHPEVVDWKHRYDFLGGVPRMVFWHRQTTPERIIKVACDNCYLMDCIKPIGLDSDLNDKSKDIHCLIHMVSREPYTNASVQYASAKVLECIVKEKGDVARRELRSLLAANDGSPLIAAFCGYIFEPYALELIERGGDFSCRNLVHGNTKIKPDPFTIKIPGSTRQIADLVSSDQPMDVLFVPKTRNHTAIDAWMRGFGVFQATVGKDHDIKLVAREDLSQMGHDSQKLYWLVPPNTFLSFTKKSPHDIDQYVIRIDYPEI